MLYNKPLAEIEDNDLQALIDNQVSERKTIEYKGTLPGNSDGDKKEFLADVSSFANATGGDLIYGVKEQAGVPVELCGLQINDVDAEILRLDDHGLPYPWVAIAYQTQPATKQETAEEKEQRNRSTLLAQHKLFLYLSEFYSNRTVSYDRIIALQQMGRIYSHGGDFLELLSPDERLNKLHEYQDEMNAFTEFLRAFHNKE